MRDKSPAQPAVNVPNHPAAHWLPFTRTPPMEYAVEWLRLFGWQMEGSVG